MNRLVRHLFLGLLVAGLVFTSSPVLAQSTPRSPSRPSAAATKPPMPTDDRIQQQLETLMIRQPPLTEDDVRLYLANAEPIYRLRDEPDRLPETIKAIGGWPEDRFAYVTTKIAVGLSFLIRPDDPRSAGLPDFVRPTPDELTLIKRYQDELTRALERAQAARQAAATGNAPAAN